MWAIAAHDEYWVGNQNVIGTEFIDAQSSFGGIDVCLDAREPQMYRMTDGHEVWVCNGEVIQVHLQDESLIAP